MGWTEINVNVVNMKNILEGEFYENVLRKDFAITEHIEIKRALEPQLREEAKERKEYTQFGRGGAKLAPPLISKERLGINWQNI